MRLDTAIKLSGAAGVPLGELIAGIEWSPGFSRRGRFEAAEGGGEADDGPRG